MKYIIKELDRIYADLHVMDKEKIADLGEKAFRIISDYPLYVSGTSNITYIEGIMIAMILVGDIDEYIKQEKQFDYDHRDNKKSKR